MIPKKQSYKDELHDQAVSAFKSAEEARMTALRAASSARLLKKQARALRNLAGLTVEPVNDEGTLRYRKTTGLVDLRWPLRQALAKRRWSIPDMLAKLGITEVSAGTIRSWLKPSQPRPVPIKWANYFEQAFMDDDGEPEVPAVNKSWPGGIQDEK